MKGWFVDKDTGRPLAKVRKEDKPGLIDAGHPFITKPIPPGLHDRERGKFAIWDFVNLTWKTDTAKEAEYQAELDAEEQKKNDALSGYQFLVDNQDDPSLTAKEVAEAVVPIFKYLKATFE